MAICQCGHARERHEVDLNCLDPECMCGRYRPFVAPDPEERLTASLAGDGRRLVRASRQHEYGNPIPLKRATARAVVAHFQECGHSNHSAAGGTLWVLIEWCELNGVRVEVSRVEIDGEIVGYVVSRCALSNAVEYRVIEEGGE